jgi:hypothetical protein
LSGGYVRPKSGIVNVEPGGNRMSGIDCVRFRGSHIVDEGDDDRQRSLSPDGRIRWRHPRNRSSLAGTVVDAGQRHCQQDGKGHGHLDDESEPGPPAPRCPFGRQSTSDPRLLSVPEVVGAPGRRRRSADRNPGRKGARRHRGWTPPPAGIDRQCASVSPRTPACTPGRAESVRRGGPGRSVSSSIGRRRSSQNLQAMPARRGHGGAGRLAGHRSRQVCKAARCEPSTHGGGQRAGLETVQSLRRAGRGSARWGAESARLGRSVPKVRGESRWGREVWT